mgnify:CR=1 FL=1
MPRVSGAALPSLECTTRLKPLPPVQTSSMVRACTMGAASAAPRLRKNQATIHRRWRFRRRRKSMTVVQVLVEEIRVTTLATVYKCSLQMFLLMLM